MPTHPLFYMPSRVFFWCYLASAFLSFSLTNSTKNPKRGLGFSAEPGDIINANQSASVISWQYNWASMPPAYLATSNIEYIPMQWGSLGIQGFADDVQAQGANTILVRVNDFSHGRTVKIFFRLSMNQTLPKSPT